MAAGAARQGFYSHATQDEHEDFGPGSFVLRSGCTLPSGTLAYRAHGT